MTKTIKIFKNIKESKRFVLFWIMRILILLSIGLEFMSGRGVILDLNIFIFLLTFFPSAIRKISSISFPMAFEFLFLLSLLMVVFFEKLLTGSSVQIVLGMFFGVIGFLLMYILFYNSRLKSSYSLFGLISFCFSVSLGAIWEIFRYVLIIFAETRLGDLDIDYAPRGLILTMLGATIVSVIGYLYIRYSEGKTIHKLLSGFRRKNPKLFIDYDKNPQYVIDLIKKGESEQLEFKSTLRTNLHTKQPDKKIEHSVLKTITAFLNTDGGTLLIGVSDNGIVSGIEKDEFKNNDRFYQHFTNLIKNHIGNEHLPFIRSTMIPIDKTNILKIDCSASSKEVFLKIDDDEEFYVRNGPASIKLVGRELIEYVNQKFKNKE